METEIFSFTQEHNMLFLMLYGLLILCGIGIVGYGLFVMPKKDCEFDGHPTKMKNVPIGFRIIMQGFPVLAGIACIVAGVANGMDSGKYYYGWENSEVLTASGIVEEVFVQTDEDGNADICFTVDGEEFTLEFSEELAEHFQESKEMAVQYSYVGDERLIYFVHTSS